MTKLKHLSALIAFAIFIASTSTGQNQVNPSQINFVRQGVKRLVFDENQAIPLASINPEEIVGINSMHPNYSYSEEKAAISVHNGKLVIGSDVATETVVWLGSFNPFATYTIKLDDCRGKGEVGFEFSDSDRKERFIVTVLFSGKRLFGAKLRIVKNGEAVVDKSILTADKEIEVGNTEIILQMLGSGFTLYVRNEGLPAAFGQADFNLSLDLREKRHIESFRSNLYSKLGNGEIVIKKVGSGFSVGVGQADIRVITYKNGDPYFDRGRLWYTMSIRGRALPHHIQGIFSLGISSFDLKLEGIVVFDRNDGLLRNEISSHIFYDPEEKIWRGLTTGFTAYANPEKEKKQIFAIESKADPRFGFSIMKAKPIGMIGDIEDSHILFDAEVQKWRIFTCRQINGYKAVLLESDKWDSGYKLIAGPVKENSTGTSIQKIDGTRFCFMGSSDREVFIYTYPGLKKAGTLKMDLPPWDKGSRTRIWPNVVELPTNSGRLHNYIALMMDRYNFPGLTGPNWSYGALYLYYGYDN